MTPKKLSRSRRAYLVLIMAGLSPREARQVIAEAREMGRSLRTTRGKS